MVTAGTGGSCGARCGADGTQTQAFQGLPGVVASGTRKAMMRMYLRRHQTPIGPPFAGHDFEGATDRFFKPKNS
jgi:hypothetical protein